MKIYTIDEYQISRDLGKMELCEVLGVSHPTLQKAILEGGQVEVSDGKPRLFKDVKERRYYGHAKI